MEAELGTIRGPEHEEEEAFWKRPCLSEGVYGWRRDEGLVEGEIREDVSVFMSPLFGACPPWRGR